MPAKTPAKKIAKPGTGRKIKPTSRKLQDFDHADARRDAMAMLSSDLNTYKRGTDNKWRRTTQKT